MTDNDLSAQMRWAADLLEKFNRLYAVNLDAEWSPALLRAEANRFDRRIAL